MDGQCPPLAEILPTPLLAEQFRNRVGVGVRVKPASTHATDEQEEVQGVYGGAPGAQLVFMGFLEEQGCDQCWRLKRCSGGPVWLSAVFHSVSTHTGSIIQLTPVLDG